MFSMTSIGRSGSRVAGGCLRGASSASGPSKKKVVERSMIGPPHPISNISPIVLREAENEGPLERRLRLHHLAMNTRNHTFWLAHNMQFEKDKDDFKAGRIKSDDVVLTENGGLSPDEFATFYKDFLNSKKASLREYNRVWLRDISLYIWLSLQVNMHKVFPWKRS